MINHPEIDAAASKKQKKLEHIAFIMDGDGRWATKRGMPREYGHTVGAKVFRRVAEYCFRGGINTVTVYAFSTENWKRPAREVNALMTLFTTYLKTGMAEMMKDDIPDQISRRKNAVRRRSAQADGEDRVGFRRK